MRKPRYKRSCLTQAHTGIESHSQDSELDSLAQAYMLLIATQVTSLSNDSFCVHFEGGWGRGGNLGACCMFGMFAVSEEKEKVH